MINKSKVYNFVDSRRQRMIHKNRIIYLKYCLFFQANARYLSQKFGIVHLMPQADNEQVKS